MTKSVSLRFFQLSLICFLFSACTDDQVEERQYLFLGHPYKWGDATKIDSRLEALTWSDYDQIWLGGDVCSKTTEKESTVEYLDSIFDLGAPTLHWALGNHDVLFDNVHYITDRTGRNTFYSTYFDGICLLVLNTNLFHVYPKAPPQKNCEEKQAQLDLIQNICDTIKQADHLIILHHLGLFTELKTRDDGSIIKAFNMDVENIRATCDSNSYVTKLVYPWLEQVTQRGVEVTLIGGDVGMTAKEFAYTTEEGIRLLGSGINNSVNPKYAPEYVKTFDPDKVLIIKHFPKTGKLDWDFKLLNNLVETDH